MTDELPRPLSDQEVGRLILEEEDRKFIKTVNEVIGDMEAEPAAGVVRV